MRLRSPVASVPAYSGLRVRLRFRTLFWCFAGLSGSDLRAGFCSGWRLPGFFRWFHRWRAGAFGLVAKEGARWTVLGGWPPVAEVGLRGFRYGAVRGRSGRSEPIWAGKRLAVRPAPVPEPGPRGVFADRLFGRRRALARPFWFCFRASSRRIGRPGLVRRVVDYSRVWRIRESRFALRSRLAVSPSLRPGRARRSGQPDGERGCVCVLWPG